MQKRPPGLVLSVAVASLGLGLIVGATGCSEEFSDDAFGVLDLTSVYDKNKLPGGDPSVTALPDQIGPQAGFLDGERAEYYDFGAVPTIGDPRTGEPKAALVQPMYFFFRPDGVPLFSTPVRLTRDGSDVMPGGKRVLSPNPKDFCPVGADPVACAQLNAAQKKRPYPLRQRDYLSDPLRGGSADYQRPIVNVSPENTAVNNPYTGLWEVIEVTVPDGYDPDAIKHAGTLQRALDSKKFKKRTTGKVINCPIVDERTYVPRGVTDRPVFRPIIELWYRRKLTFCFLANGWETLGGTTGQLLYGPTNGGAGVVVNSDSDRVDTFDVSRIVVGQDATEQTKLVVPVSKMVIPAIYTDDQTGAAPNITRLPDNILSRGRPRHFPNDGFGYSPIRWMWDLRVYPDYKIEGIKSLDDVDPGHTSPWRPTVVKNSPLRGTFLPCSYPRKKIQTGPGSSVDRCGKFVPNPENPDNENDMIQDPKGDPACTPLGLECNKDTCYCDAPFVGYGQPCGPGIAQCSSEKDGLSDLGSSCFAGFCYRRCRGLNLRAMENMGKKPTEFVDTRCGELSGYRCFLGVEVCLKNCDLNLSDAMDPSRADSKQCAAPVKVGMETRDIGDGQTCLDAGSVQVCAWPDNYTPN